MRLLIFWMIVIFSLSAIPDMKILYWKFWWDTEHRLFVSAIDWKLVLSFNNPFFAIPAKDFLLHLDTFLHKLGHLVFYAVLGGLAYRYGRTVQKALWICLGYALFDELHQAVTPGRYSRLTDVLIDMIAATLVILAAHLIRESRARSSLSHKETRSVK